VIIQNYYSTTTATDSATRDSSNVLVLVLRSSSYTTFCFSYHHKHPLVSYYIVGSSSHTSTKEAQHQIEILSSDYCILYKSSYVRI
jgi:hypothetical protein